MRGEQPGDGDTGVRGRLIAATLRLVSRYGLAKLTLDEVAREAGCSRATLYRHFPHKGALLAAVVESETARLQAGLDDALAGVTSLAEALAAVGAYGARVFAGHGALQYLLVHEPEAVLPYLCFTPGSGLLRALSAQVAPHLCRFLPPLEAGRVGEWLARIVLSYGCTPVPGRDGETAVGEALSQFGGFHASA